MFKKALVSVSDKTGLVEFLKPLVAEGLKVVSSGGTAKHLSENGIDVQEVSEVTGFPEVLDGRVKTLHPHIHAPILARWDKPKDMETLSDIDLEPFDLVVVNLYPFEQQIQKGVSNLEELIEYIDVGGPTLLRAAAKNHKFITVLCDPTDYAWVTKKKNLTSGDRLKLAAKVFLQTSVYDSVISKALASNVEQSEDLGVVTFGGRLHQKLRYGENPQQKGFWYQDPLQLSGWHSAEIIQGKELSYNNLLDLEAAAVAVNDINQMFSCAIVKHNSPCGLAFSDSASSAFEKALSSDPISAFGGVVAVNFPITIEVATAMNNVFLECIVAPKIEADARELFKKKENLRVLQIDLSQLKSKSQIVKSIAGGYLVQSRDVVDSKFEKSWTFASSENQSCDIIPNSIKEDLLLAWTAAANLKSNAIAIAKSGQSIGLGMGQVNRIDAVKQAILRMQSMHPDVQDAVLASDAFFPFSDSIKVIADAGIKWVIQPGGSKKDAEVISASKELGVNIVFTGTRHFRH